MFGLDVRRFIEKIQRNDFDAAYRLMRDKLMFPGIVCRICPHPCETACVREKNDSCISLRLLERACVEHAKKTEPFKYNLPPKAKRVAIVGAGPGGLSCAVRLASKKYPVTVFEKTSKIGGSLAEYLPEEVYSKEIALQAMYAPYELVLNREIRSLDELSDFDAIYISTGKTGTDFGLLDGWDNDTLATTRSGVVMGGEVTGTDVVCAIENGMRGALSLENFLKVGRVTPFRITDAKSHDAQYRPLHIKDEPGIMPADGTAYTPDEAVAEAKRCLVCECNNCIDHCEMMRRMHYMPRRIAHDVAVSMNAVKMVAKREGMRVVSSCNLCGLCGDLCPEHIQTDVLLTEARRRFHDIGVLPPAFHDYWLRDMAFSNSEQAALAKNAPGFETSEYAFFPGCQLGASDPRYVTQTYGYLREKNPKTGLILGCGGVPSDWAGQIPEHVEAMDHIAEQWEMLGKPKMIFACPTCKKHFAHYLPQIEGIDLYTFICEQGVPAGTRINRDVQSVFDPCAARNDAQMQQSVRKLAEASGAELEEFDERIAPCCGWGGHMYLANQKLHQEIVKNRRALSDVPYITYCSNCRDTLVSEDKRCVHLLDLLFDLNDGSRRAPSLSMRRMNRMLLKKELMESVWNEKHPEPPEKTVCVHIPAELSDKMDSLLLLDDDVIRTIAYCEETGSRILDADTGCYIGHSREGAITCWVEYRPTDDGFELVNVYCHRLQIQEQS